MIKPLFPEQKETIELNRRTPIIFDMSDPGTGKTRAHAQAFVERRRAGGGKCIVFGPKSILQPAWGNDIDEFLPGTMYSVANAINRQSAFEADADIYITNHDAIKWIVPKRGKGPLPADYWDDFDTIIIDEITAFKHHTSDRSKAMRKFVKHFEYRAGLTGTPNPNSVTELWHPTLLLDDGERFGDSFWRFRPGVQNPEATGPGGQYVKWVDKEGSEEAMYDILADITIRHKLEGLPPNRTYPVIFDMNPKLRKQYNDMMNYAVLVTEDDKYISSVHASALNNKLLQIAAGGVYTGVEKEWEQLDSGRTDLVMDLVDARPASLVVIAWAWQRQYMVEACLKRGYPFAVIDGSIQSPTKRNQAVADFQAGKLKTLIIHPGSAGHGLTLTRGVATIFASPTYNAEHYKQVFHRIFRKGQTKQTETIHIVARNTIDALVYDKLDGKLTAMQLLLDLAQQHKGTNP